MFLLALKKLIRSCVIGFKTDLLFLISIFRLKFTNKITIFHCEPWYFLTDLPSRLRFYTEMLGRNNVLLVNLSNPFHIRILEVFTGNDKKNSLKSDQFSLLNQELLCRCLSDLELKKIKPGMVVSQHSHEYKNSVLRVIHKKINQDKYNYLKVQSVFTTIRNWNMSR